MIQANEVGGNLQDAATVDIRSFAFGSALVGIGAGGAHALQASKLWKMRKSVKLAADGVTINPVVDAEGIVTGFASFLNRSIFKCSSSFCGNLYIDEAMHEGGVFSIPYVGKGIKDFMSWGWLASPVMKAANSPYHSVRSFFNRMAPNGVITKGEQGQKEIKDAEGKIIQHAIAPKAKGDSAWDFYQQYADEAKGLANYNRGKFFEANGLEGGANTKNALKNFKQTFSNQQTISQEKFGQEVLLAVQDENYKSKWPQVHEVSDASVKFFEKMGIDYKGAEGIEGAFLNPRNAWKYFPQTWNIPAMRNDPKTWMDLTADQYRAQDFTINQLRQPIQAVEEALEQLKGGKDTPARRNRTKELEAQKFRLENELNNHIVDNPDLHILLEDIVLLNEQERNELNAVLDPLRDAQRIASVKKSLLAPYAEEIKVRPKDKDIKAKYEKAKAELEEAEKQIELAHDELQRQAREGEINRKFFNRKGEDYEFLDPNKPVKLRKPFANDFELNEYVKQKYNAILNQSPDDLLAQVFGHVNPGMIEQPAYTEQRTLLFDMTKHIEAGFRDPDINKSIASYANVMGKAIGFKKAFPEFSLDKGFEGVIRHFDIEHNEFFEKINAMPEGKEKVKALNKLAKQKEKSVKFMKNTYEAYMGTIGKGDPEMQRWISALKNLVVSVKLGAVPLYQISELGAIMMNTGIYPFLANGLRPMLKSLNGNLPGKEGEELRANAANAHLAIHTVQHGYAQRLTNSSSNSYAPSTSVSEKVGVATENLSHMSGNLFGTNSISNVLETLAATLFQSEVMQAAFAHKKGTITLKQQQKMARYGIQIEDWSDRFIKGYKESGGWEMNGAHYSKYYNWADAEASNRMALSMRRMVQDTIVNRNVFSSPYWSNNPFLGMIFMFHGWAYGALNHYTIPLMQRPDAQNVLGAMTVIGLSLMVDPIKRVVAGKEAYTDDDSWFTEAYKALDYSGIVGPYAEWFEDINSALGHPIMKSFQSERYKNRPVGIGAAGPIAGYLNDVLGTVKHGLKGDWTENDVKRAERLLPFSSSPIISGILNKYISSFNLPQKRSQTEPWAYWQYLHPEE